MTDLRQAAQQALDFLMTRRMGAESVITALNEALAREHAMHELARLGQEIEQGKRGSIALARSLCYEIAGATSEDDMDGGGYGSVDIAEILSAEVVRLQAALAQPQQQAEPPPEWESIKNILDEYGLDAIAFVAAWKAVQQQAEPVAKRPWVGLTDEESTELDMEISGRTMDECVRAIEAKLKEKNDH